MKQLYSKYFPTPKFLAMSSCAIDISDHSVKYGELNLLEDGLRLGRYGKEKVPDGIVKSGKIENPEPLIKILKDLKQRENLEFVRVALPEEQIYLFTLSVPKIDGGDLYETILLQLEDHIPLQAADTLFDYNILFDDKSNVTVEVVAISAETVNSYLSVFDKSGLIPVAFELESQSVTSAVVPRGEVGTVMIIDFGEARTGISIAVDGRVVFTSTFDIGGNVFTEMIAKNYSISFAEAEIKKLKLENSEEEKEDLFPTMLNIIAVLRDEINKHFVYWTAHKDEVGAHKEGISKIIICGGGSNIPGLVEYLSVSFKTKVEYANAWTNILSTDSNVPDMSFSESLSYLTVLGLAIGDYFYD